ISLAHCLLHISMHEPRRPPTAHKCDICSDWTDPVFGNTRDFDVSGGLFGGTVGANYQTGPWVFGVEGDWDWTSLSAFNGSCAFVGCTTQSNCAPPCAAAPAGPGTAFFSVAPLALRLPMSKLPPARF